MLKVNLKVPYIRIGSFYVESSLGCTYSNTGAVLKYVTHYHVFVFGSTGCFFICTGIILLMLKNIVLII